MSLRVFWCAAFDAMVVRVVIARWSLQVRSLGCASLFALLLPAQQGRSEASAVDLRPLAATIDSATMPGVFGLVPEQLRALSKECFAELSMAELHRVLETSSNASQAHVAAAIALMERSIEPAEDAMDAEHRFGDLRACVALIEVARYRAVMARAQAREDKHWLVPLAQPARLRARARCAQLLRLHPDHASAAASLYWVEDLVDFGEARPVQLAVAKLGDVATPDLCLAASHEAKALLDTDQARQMLALGRKQMPLAHPSMRPVLRERIRNAEAALERLQQLLERSREHPDDGIALLRVLQAADQDAAIKLSAELVAKSAQHALPHSILASHDFLDGRREQAFGNLRRAAEHPGRGALYAATMMLTRFAPLVEAKEGEDLVEALRSLLAEVDESIAADDSEEARFYAWLREHLKWGLPGGGRAAMSALLEPALALHRRSPDRAYAYKVLLAAIQLSPDRSAARRELLKPLPAGLARSPSVVVARAATYVALDLLEDRRPVLDELEAVLVDVERCFGGKQQASYLRAVRLWWEATRPEADQKLKKAVLEHLRAAQLLPGEPGYQRAAIALALVSMDLGEPVEFAGWTKLARQEGGERDPDARAVEAAVMSLSRRDKPEFLAGVERFADQLDSESAAVAVHSALATAYAMVRDEAKVRGAAASAVLAQEKKAKSGTALMPGRGILLGGRVSFGLQAGRARPSIAVSYDLNFWFLPRLPDLKRLQKWAGVAPEGR